MRCSAETEESAQGDKGHNQIAPWLRSSLMFIDNRHQYQSALKRSAMFLKGARHCDSFHSAGARRSPEVASINISSLRDQEIG